MHEHISYIAFVSHCVFNTASKVYYEEKVKPTQEELARVNFIRESLENNIQLIQLPCPEFMMYGSERWGHSRYQFDNAMFRDTCKHLLEPYILQMKTYLNNNSRFKVLGIVGIEGSPSCGVNISFGGKWGGEFSGINSLNDILDKGKVENKKGVFMEVLEYLMTENNIDLPIIGLEENTLTKLLNPLEGKK